MKIIMLDKHKPPGVHGSTHRFELRRNLVLLGHEIHVIGEKSVPGENNHFHQLKLNDRLPSILKILYLPILAVKIFRLYKYEKFDITYTRNCLYGVLGLFLKKIFSTKLVFEVNGIPSDEIAMVKKEKQNITRGRQLPEFIMTISETLSLKKADGVIVVTHLLKDYVVRRGTNPHKVQVISNGANIDLFKPDRAFKISVRTRDLYNLIKDEMIVLYSGSLAPWQGVEYFINAVPKILEEVVNVRFLIVGSGLMKNKLENIINELHLSNNIVLTGGRPYEEIPNLINLADICVAPFPKERNARIGLSPSKIYEYMACGKPIVASAIPGIDRVITDSECGLLVKPEDSFDLAEKTIFLLKNKDLREKMGENAYKAAITKYSWLETAKKTETFCRNILEIS